MAKIDAKIGSSEKIKPVWLGDVYCCTTACAIKQNAVQITPSPKMAIHPNPAFGKLGTSNDKHKTAAIIPAKPNWYTPYEMDSTFFVNLLFSIK